MPHKTNDMAWEENFPREEKKTGMPGSEKRDSNKIVQIRHGM
jgi:hypothetical protein